MESLPSSRRLHPRSIELLRVTILQKVQQIIINATLELSGLKMALHLIAELVQGALTQRPSARQD